MKYAVMIRSCLSHCLQNSALNFHKNSTSMEYTYFTTLNYVLQELQKRICLFCLNEFNGCERRRGNKHGKINFLVEALMHFFSFLYDTYTKAKLLLFLWGYYFFSGRRKGVYVGMSSLKPNIVGDFHLALLHVGNSNILHFILNPFCSPCYIEWYFHLTSFRDTHFVSFCDEQLSPKISSSNNLHSILILELQFSSSSD